MKTSVVMQFDIRILDEIGGKTIECIE